jgi:prepilin-type N-terminal cleavage/methylation domain-containing protein
MVNDRFRGFTLIELIMTMSAVAILAVAGSYLMLSLVFDTVYIPNKLSVEAVADDVLEAAVEGNARAAGLRFATQMTRIGESVMEFREADGHLVEVRWDPVLKQVFLSIDGGAAALLPAYIPKHISIEQKDKKPLFTYYDSSGKVTGDPQAVRRIEIECIVKSGSGKYSDWQHEASYATAIAVRRFP